MSRWPHLREGLHIAFVSLAPDLASAVSHRDANDELDNYEYGHPDKRRSKRWHDAIAVYIRSNSVQLKRSTKSNDGWALKKKPAFWLLTTGGFMEDASNHVRDARAELEESKHALERLANQVKALSDVINPALAAQINHVRQARMTITTEVRDVMTSLREIGTFLSRPDSQGELDRLERLVRLCREMEELKKTGMLDTIVRMASGER